MVLIIVILSTLKINKGDKMKKIVLFITTLLITNTLLMAEDHAKVLFEAKCTSCHMTKRPTSEQFKTIVAPAIMGVMRHVKMQYKNKKEAVNFIVDYTLNPTKEKAICIDTKLEKFGLMLSQKESVTKEEIMIIAEYIYDTYPPTNFRGMGQGNRR